MVNKNLFLCAVCFMLPFSVDAAKYEQKYLFVDSIIYNNYKPIQSYVSLSGGNKTNGLIKILKFGGEIPNFKKLIDNMAAEDVYISYTDSSFDANGNVRSDIGDVNAYYLNAEVSVKPTGDSPNVADPIVDTDFCGNAYNIGNGLYAGCIDSTHRCPNGYVVFDNVCINPCAAVYGDGNAYPFMRSYHPGPGRVVMISCANCMAGHCACDGHIVETDGSGMAGICLANDPDSSVPINSTQNNTCNAAAADFTLGGCAAPGYKCNDNHMVYKGQCLNPLDGVIIGSENAEIDTSCAPKKTNPQVNVKNGCVIPNVRCKDNKYSYPGGDNLSGYCLDDPRIDNSHYDDTCSKADSNGTFNGCVMADYRCDNGYEPRYGRCIDPCASAMFVGANTQTDSACTADQILNSDYTPKSEQNGCVALNCRCTNGKYPVNIRTIDLTEGGYCADEPYTNAHMDQNCTGRNADGTFEGCIAAGWRCDSGYEVRADTYEFGCYWPCGFVQINGSWDNTSGKPWMEYSENAMTPTNECNVFTYGGWNWVGTNGGCVSRNCACKTGYKPVNQLHSYWSCSTQCSGIENSVVVDNCNDVRCVTDNCLCDNGYHPESGTMCVKNTIDHSEYVGNETCGPNKTEWDYPYCVAQNYVCNITDGYYPAADGSESCVKR